LFVNINKILILYYPYGLLRYKLKKIKVMKTKVLVGLVRIAILFSCSKNDSDELSERLDDIVACMYVTSLS
jgi:hypothetical protein